MTLQCLFAQLPCSHPQEHQSLLGGKHDLEVSRSGSRDASVSLREENSKHGTSLTMLRSHSSVFHAGVIGHGLRISEPGANISQVGW